MSGIYDFQLVWMSYLVAIVASYAALDMGTHIAMFEGRQRSFWHAAGAFAMGTGIWSMHFVGMRAFSLPVEIRFDLFLTLLSWVAVIGVAWLALLLIARPQLGWRSIAGGALLMGLGIVAMHYIGMWAMRMSPGINYDPVLFSASVLIAVGASAAALFICFQVRHLPGRAVVPAKIAAALIMGAAICGMHYTGMAAASFDLGAMCNPDNLLGGNWMGLPVGVVTSLGILSIVLVAVFDGRLMANQKARASEAAQRARYLAFHDPVTGLGNRSLLQEQLLKRLARKEPAKLAPFSLLHFELVSYRVLVERHGQSTASRLLAEFAQRVIDLPSEDELLTRGTPNGFTLLLDSGVGPALNQTRRLMLERLSAPIETPAGAFQPEWRFGEATYPRDGISSTSLIQTAIKVGLSPTAGRTDSASHSVLVGT